MSHLEQLQAAVGGSTPAALRAFQQREGLPATGVVDAPTLVAAEIYDPVNAGPSWIQARLGGDLSAQDSGTSRNIMTLFNQVPWWAYLTGGVLCLGWASYAWYQAERK